MATLAPAAHPPLLLLLLLLLATATTLCTRTHASSRRRLGLFPDPSSFSPSISNTFDSAFMTTTTTAPLGNFSPYHTNEAGTPLVNTNAPRDINVDAYQPNSLVHRDSPHSPNPYAYPHNNLPANPTNPNAYYNNNNNNNNVANPTNPNAYNNNNNNNNNNDNNDNENNANPTNRNAYYNNNNNNNDNENNYYATSLDYSASGTTYPTLSNTPPLYRADAPPAYGRSFPSSHASPSKLSNPPNTFTSFYSPSSSALNADNPLYADATPTALTARMPTNIQNQSPYTSSSTEELSQSKPLNRGPTFYGSFPFTDHNVATYGQVNVP